jgi:hypothetical protein
VSAPILEQPGPATDRAGEPVPDGAAATLAAPPDAPRTGSRASAWMAIAALIVAGLATPFGGQIGGADFGQLLEGRLEVRTDGGWAGIGDGAGVPAGSLVRAAGEEVRIATRDAELVLADGGELVTDRRDPELRRGSLLVDSDTDVAVRLGATRVEGRGQWRLDMGVASRVATYRGRVELDDGVRETNLIRYRQVPVRDGAIEDGRRPLRYLVGDAWDERLLGEAFAADRLAARLTESLDRSYGEEPRSPAFYAAFAAVDDVDAAVEGLATVAEDGRYGPPADVLVGVAVGDALTAGAGLDADAALDRLITLRRAGATWGLLLVEHELTASDLRQAADRALERVEASPPPPEPEPEDADDDGGAPDPAAGSPGATGPVETAEPAPTPSPSPSPGPAPSPSPAPGDDGGGTPVPPAGDDLEQTVREVEDTVGDLLDDAAGTLGDAVDDATGLVGP